MIAKVESITEENVFYDISRKGNKYFCSCPASQYRGGQCKHIKMFLSKTYPKDKIFLHESYYKEFPYYRQWWMV